MLKETRLTSWRWYVSVKAGTPLVWVWDKVCKIAGKGTSILPPALKIDGIILTNLKDVANKLANSMSQISLASYSA